MREGTADNIATRYPILIVLDKTTETGSYLCRMTDLVLIHPPVSLPCEPPPGLALLAGRLGAAGVRAEVIDANTEALHGILAGVADEAARDVAGRRALAHRRRALRQLRGPDAYQDVDRHRSAVDDLRRVLALAARDAGARLDLGDFQDHTLSPFFHEHLVEAARVPERWPFAGYLRGLARRVAAMAPRAVGLSINYLHQALPALALAGALRRACGDDVPILAGGGLVTCWRGRLEPDALAPAVDRLVFGDGTGPLLEVLGVDAPAPSSGTPDFSWAPWDDYLAPGRVATLSTSEGCFWGRCRYCPEAELRRSPTLHHDRDLPGVLDRVSQQTGAALVHLTDSAVPPASLKQLARRPWSGRWYGFTRFHPLLTQPDFCRDLRRSGCVMLQLGLESGSPAVLRRLNKGIDLGQASAALQALSGAGVATYLYVMFGTPGEERADALQTLRFVADHAPHLGFINTSLLNLPLSSPPEDDLARRPYPGAPDLSLYEEFSHDTGWDRRAARRFLEREFARHPAVAPVLRRTPTVFGANHAPFFIP